MTSRTNEPPPARPVVEPLAVDVAADGVRVALSRDRVAVIARSVLRAERVRNAMLSITFLDEPSIARLNWQHLRHRGPTDVISFGLSRDAPDAPVVGDIYIAPAVIRDHARENGVPVREELTRVVVHGVLHVLGHDHPEDDGRERSPMWRRQESLVRRLLVSPTT
ncbi:MAG: rRNA maturation RNase YbeY [Gemmatimonadaceae bacterium]